MAPRAPVDIARVRADVVEQRANHQPLLGIQMLGLSLQGTSQWGAKPAKKATSAKWGAVRKYAT